MKIKMQPPKYIKDILDAHEPLPSSEQIELIKKAQNGDAEAQDKLVLTNSRFVVREVQRLATIPIRLEFSDLFNEGITGLITAIERFNPNKDVCFLTYAYWWIKKKIMQAVYSNISLIHIPKARVKQLERLHNLCELQIQRHHKEGTLEKAPETALEMAQHIFGDSESPLDSLTFMRLYSARQAFDITTIEPDEDDHNTRVPEQLYTEDKTEEILLFDSDASLAIDALTDREEDIIKRYFGIDCSPHEFREIANIYVLTPERVRQILQEALYKMRGCDHIEILDEDDE